MQSPEPGNGIVADALSGNWVDRFAPDWLKPYARLARWDRPIGFWLLFWPCGFALALATVATPGAGFDVWSLILFFIGAVAMRGAGCTFNDIVDTDIDQRVERTRSRPIPSGQVTRKQAWLFLVIQSLVGAVVLFQFNWVTILLGIASLALVAIYPFMKRITNWPQLFLGFAFSWGALMGWAVAFGRLELPAVLLYAGAILWTIGYDTIYAHQDKEDDALVGVRSTARLFGRRTRPALLVLYGGATLLFACAAASADAGPAAFLGIAAGAVHLIWQIAVLDIDDPDQCLRLFRSNTTYGWIVFTGLLVDAVITAI